MKPLKNFFISQRMRLFSNFPKVERLSISYAWAKNVGVLAYIENPSQVRTIRGFVEQLEREGKKVNCLVFTTHREAIQELEKAQILSYQDITLWGNWKNQAVSRFMSQPFDYLFCLSTHLLPPITYILQHCKAKCRVGIYREEHQKFFELMVGTPYFSLEVLADEILHRSRSIVSVRPQVLVEA